MQDEKLSAVTHNVPPVALLPVCTPRRVEIAWHPSSLLSKRMHIKNSGGGAAAAAADSGGGEGSSKDLDLKAPAMEAPVSRPDKSSADKGKAREQEEQRPLTESEKAEFLKHDVYLQPVFDKYQGGESQGDDDIIPDDAAVATAAAVDKTTAALPTFVPRAQRLAGSSGVNASHSTMPFQHTKRPPVRAVIVPREDDDDNGRTNSDDDDGETPKITLKRRLPSNNAAVSGGIRVGGVSIAGTTTNSRLPPPKKRIVVSAWQDEDDDNDMK
eukprot:gene15878-11365_t